MKFKQTISFELFKIIFIFYFLLIALMEFVNISTQYSEGGKQIKANILSIKNSFQPILEKAFWEVDLKQIDAVGKGIAEFPDVAYIKIESYESSIIKNKKISQKNKSYSEDKLKKYSFFVSYRKKTLGKVEIYISMKNLHSRIRFKVYMNVLGSLILFVLLMLTFLIVSRNKLQKPLEILSEASKEISLDNIENIRIDTGIQNNNELLTLEKSFNSMLRNLAHSKIRIEEEIKQRKITEEALVHQKERAEQANKAKSLFLANMSHEIRTPMNGIVGMTEILTVLINDKSINNYLENIKVCTDQLLRIINDILDISKIEAGKVELNETEFEFELFIEKIINNFALEAHRKNIELVYKVDSSISEFLIGDSGKLSQVLNNLFSNAFKFTEKGNIFLHVKHLDETEDEVQLEFSVSDTGIGMSSEIQNNIFDAFVQGDVSYTKKYQGTGLGLSICKNIIKLMGGKIFVESTLDLGSNFYFVISLKKSKELIHNIELLDINLTKAKVLLIDYDKTNRNNISDFLIEEGITVSIAQNEDEAFKFLNLENYYNIFLLDLGISKIDDFSFLEKIRNTKKFRNSIVILFTLVDIQNELPRLKTLGVDDYLIKPIKKRKLIVSIKNVLNKKYGKKIQFDLEVIDAIDRIEASKKTILLAEDQEISSQATRKLLKLKGYNVLEAENGIEVLKILEQKHVDLILMDIQMPELNGYDASKIIRKEKKWSNIPIIALTAYTEFEDQVKFKDIGMNAYLSKPIKPEEFYKTVKNFL